MSPLTPPPEMTGSAVVVSVLPLAGLVMVGAAGRGRHVDGEGVGGGGRAGPAGGGLRRGDRVAGVAQGRGRRVAPGAVGPPAPCPTSVPSMRW